ncbi:hypothetical protein BJD55_gp041 [Gordonia phage Yvonnetastic]|uniref:Uncharacterized protein n=1 Tax=Gordonia phage Yvonnetastic TaxID=1821566 RepID=A0A142K9E2_9CAUD|nr:hypothetical protein BJD55_gp041 [Gordonia phage Yvonnetastic]AMS02725.1 hypothetical protein SEA_YVONNETASTIC_181 [Gordonia phage Yvonnetastic]WKW86154.1 hypothetical protein SEA_JONJAMES_181 [Gordonia Phage JonJames]
MDTEEGHGEKIFQSELYGAIIRQQISDAQATQRSLDNYHAEREAQLNWLKQAIEDYALSQDSKSVEYKLLRILHDSWSIKSEEVAW